MKRTTQAAQLYGERAVFFYSHYFVAKEGKMEYDVFVSEEGKSQP
jgi:hypothetical protein